MTIFEILKRCLIPGRPAEYVVLNRNEQTGAESRTDGRRFWLHIFDKEKFRQYLMKKQNEALKDLRD